MAIQRLDPPYRWGYDDVTGEIVIEMRRAAPDSDPDPANYLPDKWAEVRLVVASITVHDIT